MKRSNTLVLSMALLSAVFSNAGCAMSLPDEASGGEGGGAAKGDNEQQPASLGEDPTPFYTDRTVQLRVGFAAGGDYDARARLYADFLGKHIEGNPTVEVVNESGEASASLAGRMASDGGDGLSMGMWHPGLLFQQALGNTDMTFDDKDFAWIGSPQRTTFVCGVMGRTGVRSFDDLLALTDSRIIVGAADYGSATYITPFLLKELLGAPLEIVPGFAGTSGIREALWAGDADMLCTRWSHMSRTAWRLLEASNEEDRLIPILVGSHDKDITADDGLAGLPSFETLAQAKGDDHARVAKAWLAVGEMAWPLSVPAGTPPERIQALRRAFDTMMINPDFLVEAETREVSIGPTASALDLAEAVGAMTGIRRVEDEGLRAMLQKLRTDLVEPTDRAEQAQ